MPSGSGGNGRGGEDSRVCTNVADGDAGGVVSTTTKAANEVEDAAAGADDDDNHDDDTAAAATLPGWEAHDSLLLGCRSVENYERLNHIDEGTYGIVSRARCLRTGRIVALKQVKMSADAAKEGFPVTALREINVLLALVHPNVMRVHEMVVGSTIDHVYMVMEFMEHDLKQLMGALPQPFEPSEVKCLMAQLLGGVAYMHSRWFLHRDLKPSNLLYSNEGRLALGDLGLARQYGEPVRRYTHMVVTLWYRAPELLLGCGNYSAAVDVWSVGCIFAEIVRFGKVLFQSNGEIDQLDRIFKLLGAPNEENWPGYAKLPGSKAVRWKGPPRSQLGELFPSGAASFGGEMRLTKNGFDLLSQLLCLDPERRITAAEALTHPYFDEPPLAKSQARMPKFPAAHVREQFLGER